MYDSIYLLYFLYDFILENILDHGLNIYGQNYH